MMKQKTQEEIILGFQEKHNGRYDYSKVAYNGCFVKVCIICPEHGDFWQTPHDHLSGSGCPICAKILRANKRRLTLEQFIEKARAVHEDKYDYSKVNYVNNSTKVCIICPEHGKFWQVPSAHLKGEGCPKCANFNKTTEELIRQCKEKHGDKYDYSEFEYKGWNVPAKIICPEHGAFYQTPYKHKTANGCPICGFLKACDSRKPTIKELIDKFRKIHGNKYDYSNVTYKNNRTKIKIICPKHGEFWQSPYKHILGQGCPRCNESKLERKIALLLEKEGIAFEEQKKFDWLGRQRLDFYLPKYNSAIECQGEQHFEPIKYFGGIKKLEIYQQRDETKKFLCYQNDVNIIYINHFDSEEEINNKLNEIFNGKTKL